MKKSKIIAPALGVLILSTAASITGTVAWFSANSTVTATGMNLKAKSDSTYLVIADSVANLDDEDEFDMEVVGDNDAALELYPVSYTTSGYGTNGQPGYVAANSWFTATGTTTSDGTAQAASRQGLTISETTAPFGIANSKNYYVFSKFVIGLASGSALATEGLQADVTFTATGNSSFNDCLSVWIVYDTTGFPTAPTSGTTTQKFVFEDADASGVVHSSDLQDVTLEDPIYVKVYAFFDGDNEACTTNNAVSLDDISIEIEFTVNEALHGAQQNP